MRLPTAIEKCGKNAASCAGLTRASINLRKSLSKRMDCRVKPGNDDEMRECSKVKPGNDDED